MKKSLKFGLGGLALAAGIFALTSCTSSFCSITDKAHILYLFDYGVTNYSSTSTAESEALTVTIDGVVYSTNLYTTASFDEANDESNAKYINKINDAAEEAYIRTPSLSYFEVFDQVVLNHAFEIAIEDNDALIGSDIIIDTISHEITFVDEGALLCLADQYDDYSNNKGLLDKYGYIKYDDLVNEDKTLWADWNLYNQEVRDSGISVDELASSDYISFYQKKMNSYISSYRSCLAVNTGDYGAYGVHSLPAQIEGKAWTDWYGLLEFLFVWPIGALVDFLAVSFSAIGSGWAEILAILVVTFIVRSLMLFVTFKQQKSTTVMTELQPEIAKIQSKYPNANTNKMEKQRLSEETARLYKKHKINPLTSILVMLIQFPVFICVWGAMQGAACLSSGEFLGLRLSDSIGSTILQASSWTAAGGFGGLTAAILFVLMAAAQTVAMLLPRWLQKRKTKKVAKLGRNPAQASQDSKMKWFTYIMLGFIVLMGLSLASGMGVYWLFGALFSVAQSFVTQSIVNKKDKKRR